MADTLYDAPQQLRENSYYYRSLLARRKASEKDDLDQADKYISLCRQKGDNSYAMVFI